MTTLTLPTAQEHRQAHDQRAVCIWCSDQVPWWREARIRAGIGREPPFVTRCYCGRWPKPGSPFCHWHA